MEKLIKTLDTYKKLVEIIKQTEEVQKTVSEIKALHKKAQ